VGPLATVAAVAPASVWASVQMQLAQQSVAALPGRRLPAQPLALEGFECNFSVKNGAAAREHGIGTVFVGSPG
jgi:hypothetical protein